MEFTTTFFFIVGGTLCLVTSIFFFISYFKTKQRASLSLAFVSFWIALHAYAFSLPTIIDPGNLELLAVGYIVGIAALFLVQISGLEVQNFMTKHATNINFPTIGSLLITLVASITLIIMSYDFRTPIFNDSGIIFWNVNKIAQWLIGLSSLTYGLFWNYVFYQAAIIVDDSYARFRLMIIGIAGTSMGTTAFLVHTSSSEIQTLTGHIIFVISGLMILGIFIIPKRLFSSK